MVTIKNRQERTGRGNKQRH